MSGDERVDKDVILIVDDIELNREILAEILSDQYETRQACNGLEAVEMVLNQAENISLVLLDIMMPEMDGYEVLEILGTSGYLEKIPFIIITASGGDDNEIRCLGMGAVDFVNKPFNPDIVKSRVKAQVELKKHRDHLEELVEFNVQKITRVRENTVEFLASVIEYRHIESGQHVKRTRLMTEILLRYVRESGNMDEELSQVNPRLIVRATPLHDIGKISTPDHILLKPGKLTPEEFEVIKDHTRVGAALVDGLKDIEEPEYIRYCREICLHHHERWDGKGYPCGLAEKSIPLSARLMSIVDVYDALVNERVYKPAMLPQEALEILRMGAGLQFDPILVDIFLKHHESFQLKTEDSPAPV